MILLFLIIATNIFILSRLNFFPYPELFLYPYLTNHGLIPYKDILDQHFPGLMFFPINLGNLGMTSPEIARYWQHGLVVIAHVLIYLVAKKFLGGKKAILANIIFAIWHPYFEGWVLWIDSFLPVLTLSALYFIRSKKLFWAGLMLGLALVFKQVILPLIALVGIYLLFTKTKIKPLFYFVIGILIPIGVLIFYISKLNVWNDFIFWTVTFNVATFAEMGRKYGLPGEWARVLGVYGFAAFAFLGRNVKKEVLLVSLFLIGSLASIFARFDFVHLQPSLPYVAILSAIALNYLISRKYLRFLIPIYIVVTIFLLTQFFKGSWGNKTYFSGSLEQKVTAKIQQISRSDEKIFAFGTLPHIYEKADRLPPGNVFVFQFPWFMIEAENRILTGIIQDPPRVVIRDREAEVGNMKLIDYMPKISEYVTANYKVVDIVEGIEIMITN